MSEIAKCERSCLNCKFGSIAGHPDCLKCIDLGFSDYETYWEPIPAKIPIEDVFGLPCDVELKTVQEVINVAIDIGVDWREGHNVRFANIEKLSECLEVLFKEQLCSVQAERRLREIQNKPAPDGPDQEQARGNG